MGFRTEGAPIFKHFIVAWANYKKSQHLPHTERTYFWGGFFFPFPPKHQLPMLFSCYVPYQVLSLTSWNTNDNSLWLKLFYMYSSFRSLIYMHLYFSNTNEVSTFSSDTFFQLHLSISPCSSVSSHVSDSTGKNPQS